MLEHTVSEIDAGNRVERGASRDCCSPDIVAVVAANSPDGWTIIESTVKVFGRESVFEGSCEREERKASERDGDRVRKRPEADRGGGGGGGGDWDWSVCIYRLI